MKTDKPKRKGHAMSPHLRDLSTIRWVCKGSFGGLIQVARRLDKGLGTAFALELAVLQDRMEEANKTLYQKRKANLFHP